MVLEKSTRGSQLTERVHYGAGFAIISSEAVVFALHCTTGTIQSQGNLR